MKEVKRPGLNIVIPNETFKTPGERLRDLIIHYNSFTWQMADDRTIRELAQIKKEIYDFIEKNKLIIEPPIEQCLNEYHW